MDTTIEALIKDAWAKDIEPHDVAQVFSEHEDTKDVTYETIMSVYRECERSCH